jgi:hypothetical protein
MSAQGIFVYHPLGPKAPLFELWREAIAQRGQASPVVPPELLKHYRAHLAARPRGGVSVPDEIKEHHGRLAQDFRAFFPVFLERIGAPPDRARIPVSFPALALFDARAAEVGEQRGIFVSSRALEVIGLFARTMSLCARLNGLATPVLAGHQDPPPPHVLLAWLALRNDGLPGFSLQELLQLPPAWNVKRQLEQTIFTTVQGFTEEVNHAWSRHRLAAYLAQAALVAMERLLRGDGWEAGDLLEIPEELPPCEEAASLDARYLATVVLTFLVLHEHGHLAHRHNSLEPMVEDPQIKQIVEGMMRYAKDHPGEVSNPVDLRGSVLQLEQDADCFPIEVTHEDYRDAMLEAATLWFTALASADRSGMDWLEKSVESKGRAYPQYAMRVWFLNGRFSTGARQGEIAQAITRTAESIEARPSGADIPGEKFVPLFGALWKIAREEAEPTTLSRLSKWFDGLPRPAHSTQRKQ